MSKKHFIINSILVLAVSLSSSAFGTRYMEKLNRGLTAVYKGNSQVYIGWRMFGTEPSNVGYNIYRNDVKLNSSPIINSTNYMDYSGSTSSIYKVAAVIDGQEQEKSSCGVWSNSYFDIPIQIPEGVTTPDGYTCSYSPNDASVGDLDGDGQYDIILKWQPSNAKDNANSGYSGNVYLDAYRGDGQLLWRIDLGGKYTGWCSLYPVYGI